MTAITIPFNGNAWYKVETTYGDGTVNAGTGLAISDKIYNVSWDWGDTFKPLRGIAAQTVCAFISTPSNPTLHLEWVDQQTISSLATYCCVRNSTTSDLSSLAIEVISNLNAAAGTHSYYSFAGCKCKTFNIKASTGNEFICTADFSVCSIRQTAVSSMTSPTALGTTYGVFNQAGNVIAKNTNAAIATIVDSIDITINNNVQDLWDHDSPFKQACIACSKDVTGTVGLVFDDGGKSFADNLYVDLTNVTLTINALTNWKTWTFTNARFDGLGMQLGTANEGMKTSQKFTAKDFSVI